MSHAPHLLIPCASHGSEACRERMHALALPQLQQLLSRLVPDAVDEGPATSFSPPHERVLARAYGLHAEDGQIPWAAWQARQEQREDDDQPWAWITPCHWQMGTDRATMLHPAALQLGDAEARALLALMQPYFAQDGIQLSYDAPTRWLARGAALQGLQAASLDRAVGQSVDAWLPRGPHARTLRRLQSEMQMLLYTQPLNEERERGGLLPINSFWVSGAGQLPTTAGQVPPGLRVTHYLRDAAVLADWDAWASAWHVLDTGECARLLRELDQGLPVTLTLCGEARAHSYTAGTQTFWRRFGSHFRRQPTWKLLESL